MSEANVVAVRSQSCPAERLEDRFVERPAGGRIGALDGDVSEQHAQKYSIVVTSAARQRRTDLRLVHVGMSLRADYFGL